MPSNPIIWITGASSGIGEATAYRFAGEQASLILTARRAERLAEVQQECIRLGARCEVLPCDLSNLSGLDTLTDQAVALFGRIDIAFLNAGISQRSTVLESTPDVTRRIMELNFFSPTMIARRLLPSMIAQGGGTIAVTTSIVGRFGFPLRSAYASSKFALYGFFETLQAEYYDDKIRVVMVCPGRVKTAISLNALEANGSKHDRMDEGQQHGITADKAARKIAGAIKKQKPEVLVGGPELLMVYIKRFLPSLSRKLARRINAI
ncbi:MAG: short-chain dehydrogenase [Proteiniphilum sp.]|jgi:short-subunit dehydrogenase|nr:short-chain dehydrogenase [Proteiniphilum sp.]